MPALVKGPALDGFSEATRAWFAAAFAEPTQAQAQAWTSIGNGENALVIAPTGSGKTLAAFLWAIDKLATEPVPADPRQRCRVLYISPLKALAVDIERNLRSPLTGVGHAARRLGLPEPDIRVGVRTGDTAADERRKLSAHPPDILITTPESLFLLLTSQAREVLRSVETVIVDEVHALAGGKRGAHLALSLERLDALCCPGGTTPQDPPARHPLGPASGRPSRLGPASPPHTFRILLDLRDDAVAHQDAGHSVDALARVQDAPPDNGQVRHTSPSAARRGSVAASASAVRSRSAWEWAVLRKPDPWNRCTPSRSMPQCRAVDSGRGRPAFSVAGSRWSGASGPNSRWNTELSP
jgi:hypothetical protein